MDKWMARNGFGGKWEVVAAVFMLTMMGLEMWMTI